MKPQKKLVFGIVALVFVVVIGIGVFVWVQRATQGSASSFRPGMMMRGSSGPSRLIAVSQQGTPVPTASGDKSLPDNTAAQKIGNLKIQLAISPYPPVSFSQSDFTVTLSDENGGAVTDATISLDMTMPEMPMPANMFDVKHSGNGVYLSQGRFTMRGWWRIEAIIQRDGKKQSAFFDLGL
jgi:hypothetical protein